MKCIRAFPEINVWGGGGGGGGGGGIGRHFYFLPTMHQIFKIITPPYTKYKLLLYPPCIKFN